MIKILVLLWIIKSEGSHSFDTFHCVTADIIFEPVGLQVLKNDGFLNLALQTVGNSIIVTDSGPINTNSVSTLLTK